MKINRFLSMLLTLAILISTFTIPVMANNDIKVLLNGETLSFDVPPQLINDRTMVPMRKIFEAMGATVDWNESTQTVTAKEDNIVIIMQIDNVVISVNDKDVTLDVPPQLVDSRTLVPVRAVVEGLDADVKWDGDTQTVIITKEEKPSDTPTPTPTPQSAPMTYNIGGETIQSFTVVVGTRNFESMEIEPNPSDEDSTMYFYSYYGIENPKQDAEQYRDYLANNPKIKMSNVGEYASEGEDDTVVIALGGWLAGTDTKLPILIAYSQEEKTVQIIITVAGREDVKETSSAATTKRVGEDDYGYITIPSDWVNFLDAGMAQAGIAHIGFMSFDGFIINLATHGRTTTTLEQVVNGSTLGNLEKTEIAGFEAYQLSSYFDFDDTYLYAWYFFDSESNLRYISAEGPADRIAEAVEIVEKTFSLSK